MEITTDSVGETTVLRLQGNFTNASRGTFKDWAERVKKEGCRHLILDMEHLTFIDSAALGLLALLAQTWGLENRRLSLLRPQAFVQQVLQLERITDLIPVYYSKDDAIQATA